MQLWANFAKDRKITSTQFPLLTITITSGSCLITIENIINIIRTVLLDLLM